MGTLEGLRTFDIEVALSCEMPTLVTAKTDV